MADLHSILPHFDTRPFGHLIPSLDRHRLTVCDLLSLDGAAIQKRTQLPVGELRKLQDAVCRALHADMGLAESPGEGDSDDQEREAARGGTGHRDRNDANGHGSKPQKDKRQEWRAISTLDDGLDAALVGGIPTGYVVEVTGESATAKTLFLLHLLLSVQLPPPAGLAKSAIYISTESPLPTRRLTQLLTTHPALRDLPTAEAPSLSRILSIAAPDAEAQDHILRYQLPVAVRRHDVGLVVLDSVAANFRADFDHAPTGAAGGSGGASSARQQHGSAMARRGAQLVQLGALLRGLARSEDVAVVVANQVADRFSSAPTVSAPATSFGDLTPSDARPAMTEPGGETSQAVPAETQGPHATREPLMLDHQQRWFTGWGDSPERYGLESDMKTPSLGLVWANQIAARIALLREPVHAHAEDRRQSQEEPAGKEKETDRQRWRRKARVVFAPWAAPSPPGAGVEFEVVAQGLRSIKTGSSPLNTTD